MKALIYPLLSLALSLDAFSALAQTAPAEIAPPSTEAPVPPAVPSVAEPVPAAEPAPVVATLPELCPKDMSADQIIAAAKSKEKIGTWESKINVATGDTYRNGKQLAPLKIAFISPKPLKDAVGEYCKYTISDANGVSGVFNLYFKP